MLKKKASAGYGALLLDGSFESFLWTQFLGAFNDNVYKMIVSVAAVHLAANELLGARYLAMAGAVFVIPFLLFAGYAGQIADRYSKTRVLKITKAFEIVIMILGVVALGQGSLPLLLVVLFLLAAQANFFSPAKYGVLPEMLDESQITRANGLLELSTFAAIVLGSSVGSLLFAHWKDEPMILGGVLLGIAILGSLTSIFIRDVPASGSREPFHLNPFSEVWAGAKRIYGERALWLTVMGISYFWFIGAMLQMTIILLGSESLRLSDAHTGLLVTALAAGIGLGSIAAGWLSGDRVEVGLVPVGAGLIGICSILLGSPHSFVVTMALLAGVGFAGGLFIVPLNAYLQEGAAPEEKGRLLATNNFVNMLGVILASGALYLLHDTLHWNPRHILAAVGVMTIVATLYIAWLIPASLVRLMICACAQIFFRIRIIGSENIPKSGGGLIVANHVSYADAIIIGCAGSRLIRFLMWQPIYENKWLNPVCRLFEAIPLVRNSAKEAIRALRHARTELEKGNLVGIFPEGALTRTCHVQPFERGIEVIRRGLESTPIIPIYLDGLWGHALSLKGGQPFGASRLRLRHEVTLYIGEPISGAITAEQLHQRIIDLSADAAEYRKNGTATLSHRFVKSAKKHWSSIAVADSSGKQMTFGETLTAALLLKKWVNANAAGSQSIGLLFPACVGGVLANLGVTLAGKTAVNLNFTTGAEGMRHAVDRCNIRVILSSRAFLEKAKLPELLGTVFLEDVLSRFSGAAKATTMLAARVLPARVLARSIKSDDIAAVIFSSGSTGTPKGVMLSHWNLLSNVEAAAQVYSVTAVDCMLGVLPLFHSFGYTYTFWFPLLHGFKAAYHANPTEGKIIGELAAEHRATLFLSTPTFCLTYLRKCTREQLSSIRYLLVGGEKLQPSLAQAFEERFGVTPLEGYGCTEMGPVVSVNAGSHESQAYQAGSVGRPMPNVSVLVVDPDSFDPLPTGKVGLLLVRGPSRMIGYLGDPERTGQALHRDYYITGDLGFLDEQQFLHIADRLARFSKIGGEMVPHIKIEELAHKIVGAHSCAVTAIPDEQKGERIVLLYTHPELTPAELWRGLSETELPKLWVPKRENIYRVESIPTLGTGKLDLRAIKTKALELTAPVGAIHAN